MMKGTAMIEENDPVYKMGERNGNPSYVPPSRLSFNSMRLATDLTAILEPFYSKIEREKITKLYYDCIEKHLREHQKGNVR